jgi:transposase
MDFIKGNNRDQMTFSNLEMQIEQDNPVRFVDAFVEHLDLSQLGFVVNQLKTEGRPAYESKLFLKIYLYGYLNGIRSSRRLEKECMRNLELHWLINLLQPNYHSIADFRKVNPSALKNVFKLFVLFLKEADLIGGITLAIDGTKIRAHNSKKTNYNPKKIERHLKYIEEKTNEYLTQLDANDAQEDPIKITGITEKIERLKKNKLKYESLSEQMTATGEPQVSTTDADARALLVQGQVVEVCYNVQAAVDDKYKLIIATHTINRNDRNALSAIAMEAKENLGKENFQILVDKGYHNGREIQKCTDENIVTIVAQQEIVNSNEHGTTPDYLVTHFIYNTEEDTYTCPQGQTLHTTGTWHKKSSGKSPYRFKKYRTPQCKTCPVKHLCTGRADGRREIDRSEYADAVESNSKRYKENKELYRKRQEINEHIFGTIKRKWGFNHTNLKGLQKVNGEMALIMTVYNIRRCITILGIPELINKLKNWTPDYGRILFSFSKLTSLKATRALQVFDYKLAA